MSLSTLLGNPVIDRALDALVSVPASLTFGDGPIAAAKSPRRSLIGTAFDYLFRFTVEREYPLAAKRESVAAEGLRRLGERGGDSSATSAARLVPTIELSNELLIRARRAHARYLADGLLTEELLKGVLYLAHIDLFVRSKAVGREFGVVYLDDLKELAGLHGLVPIAAFEPRRIAC